MAERAENEHAAEVPLVGGDVTTVVRVGDTVRRTAQPWTPFVHDYLRHLADRGITEVPRPLGFDAEGREVLSFMDGDAALLPLRVEHRCDEALAGVGAMLRRIHDAGRDYRPPPGAVWQRLVGSPGGPEMCHNDLFPPNVVFDGSTPTGLIDWDFLAPEPLLFDVASAAKHWVPLMAEERAVAEGWEAPDRPRRLRLLTDAYGLTAAERVGLLDACRLKQSMGLETHRQWAAAGVPAFVAMVENGSLELIQADIDWLDANAVTLARSLA